MSEDAAAELANRIKSVYEKEGVDVPLDAVAGSFSCRLERLMSRCLAPVNGEYEVRVSGIAETFYDPDPLVALCRAYVGAVEVERERVEAKEIWR